MPPQAAPGAPRPRADAAGPPSVPSEGGAMLAHRSSRDGRARELVEADQALAACPALHEKGSARTAHFEAPILNITMHGQWAKIARQNIAF
eukprot:scaffold679981_cov38-Prasinocladus_malaysianus.AAC.1